MRDIPAATREQRSGIEPVNLAMVQMAQQNAALVEGAVAATRSLEEQSQALLQSAVAFIL